MADRDDWGHFSKKEFLRQTGYQLKVDRELRRVFTYDLRSFGKAFHSQHREPSFQIEHQRPDGEIPCEEARSVTGRILFEILVFR